MSELDIFTRTSAESFLNNQCRNVRLRYYQQSYSGGEYDDQVYVTQSGNDIWINGYVEPLTASVGGEEKTLTEAGKITKNDSKLYIAGSLATDIDIFTKIGFGSPTSTEYAMIEKGDTVHHIKDTPIYDLIFVRKLNTGSFVNEV